MKDNNANISPYGNHCRVIIETSNVGETYYLLKTLEKKQQKTYSYKKLVGSLIQNPNYNTSIEIKPIDKSKGSVFNFDEMLGAETVLK